MNKTRPSAGCFGSQTINVTIKYIFFSSICLLKRNQREKSACTCLEFKPTNPTGGTKRWKTNEHKDKGKKVNYILCFCRISSPDTFLHTKKDTEDNLFLENYWPPAWKPPVTNKTSVTWKTILCRRKSPRCVEKPQKGCLQQNWHDTVKKGMCFCIVLANKRAALTRSHTILWIPQLFKGQPIVRVPEKHFLWLKASVCQVTET